MQQYYNLDYLDVDQYQETYLIDSTSTELEEEEEYEIGVRPKKKLFNSSFEKQLFIEEYTKKKKTELCKNFMLKNSCKFGQECSYAHGYAELLPKTHLHKNYKTKLCKNFINNGCCNYGARCQYIHPENTLNNKNVNRKKCIHEQTKIPKIPENKYKSPQKQNQIKTLIDFVTYSEILQNFNSSQSFIQANLPRLSYFRQLEKKKICFLSDESDL